MGKEYRGNRKNYKKEKEGEKPMAKKCPFCGGDMKAKGASDCCGGMSFKCRNKKCGRRVWIRKPVTNPRPIVPTSRIERYLGRV